LSIKVLCLSYPLRVETPVYGNLPKLKITPYKSIAKGDSCNICTITICNHTGTHVDAPAHFVLRGRPISDYLPEELTFHHAQLIDTPKEPGEYVEKEDVKARISNKTDCLLIRTGFGVLRAKDIYRTNNPGISPEAILWLRQKIRKIRCIGIDSISISGFQDRPRGRKAHLAAFEKRRDFGEPLLLLEDVNLSALKAGVKIQKITVVPWSISGVDSAPCTVLAEVADHE
jgi:kynurenine formamidase